MTYVEPTISGPVVRTFSAAFPRDQMNGPASQGDTPDGQTTSATVEINRTNMTSAAFSFTIIDNYRFAFRSPAGATFRVTSPEGNSSEAVCPPGGSLSATVQFAALNIPPDEMMFVAGDEKEAQKTAAGQAPACDTGSGAWTIEITVQRDYATPIHAPGGSISWSLDTRFEFYSLQVAELYRS